MTLASPALNNLIVGLIVFTNLYFVYLISKTQPKKELRKVFSLLSMGIAGWILFAHLGDITNSSDLSILFNRIVYDFLTITGLALLNFPFVFPKERDLFILFRKLMTVIGVVIITVTTFTPWILKDVQIFEWGASNVDGNYFFVWAMFLTIGFFSPFQYIFLWKKYSAQEKQKLKYLILGLFLFISANVFVHMILGRLILKSDEAYRFGNYSAIFLLVAIGYSIAKHRLFGLRFVLGKTMYYLFVALIPFASFYIIEYLLRTYVGGIYSPASVLLGFIFSLFFIYILLIANTSINRFITRRIINTGYDPEQIRDMLAKKFSKELHLSIISEEIINVINETISPTSLCLVIFNQQTQKIISQNNNNFATHLNYNDILLCIEYWKHLGTIAPFSSDELLLQGSHFPLQAKLLQRNVANLLEKFDIQLVLPLKKDLDKLNCLILLGERSDGKAYTVEDYGFLDSLLPGTSVAIERSLLYEQVQNFAENLEDRVDDATEQLESQAKQLKRKNTLLQKAAERERDMMDIVGHELRTPATVVKNAIGYIQMLERMDKLSTNKLNTYLKKAAESIDREIKLINTFLGAAKLQGQQMQFDPIKFSMQELIKQVVSENMYRAKERGLTLNYKIAKKQIPEVVADRTRMAEVVDNLISNAIKYTPKGTVTVWCETNAKKTSVTVYVKDTGMGIAKKDQKTLFTKFGRIRNYINERERMAQIVRPGGTGLGLYVVKGIIDLHGGEIKVKSKLGEGSMFYFTIPTESQISKKNLINPIFAHKGEKNIFKKLDFTSES